MLLKSEFTSMHRYLRAHVSRFDVILAVCALFTISARTAFAQDFQLSSAEVADSAALARSIPRLAAEVLAAYRDTNRLRFLDNRFRLEALSGKFRDAAVTLSQARVLRDSRGPSVAERAAHVQYEIYVRARNLADSSGRPFAETFPQVFRERFATLDDRTAAVVGRRMRVSAATAANDLRWATPNQAGKTTVSLDDALSLLRVYHAVAAYQAFGRISPALVTEDERRRYDLETNVAVKTPDGATLCAVVARPKPKGQRKLPALVQFTIYADSIVAMRETMRVAANGYAGVMGYTRGKGCSTDRIVAYVNDGADAAALVDWIAAQPWSDGRVGMYGGSYSGFTAWATTKRMPKALKAIMVGAPAGPGIDVPMERNVVWNFIYPWPFYTMNNRWLDDATYDDDARWRRLNQDWYRSGRPYRELEKIDGTPNPEFAEWLAHPTVDAYWQATIPQGREYAAINIPVLQTAGYFFGGPGAAVYYFLEHYKHNPRAEHYLVIGPYDHRQAQSGVVTVLGDTATFFAGYTTDPVAHVDLVADLRYQWFDYALKGGPRPAMLKDRVNYQVPGANVWKSARSIAAMSNGRVRLYLNPARSDAGHRFTLTPAPAAPNASITHTVNFADRSDVDARPVGGLLDTAIDTSNAIVLVSERFKEAMDISGLLSGSLELVANKKDFDFSITLYELMADGRYFQLPPYITRASHVESLTERRLLTPGKVERLKFASGLRMMVRRVSAGSRIVMVLSVIKNQQQQINYGTGKDVNDESISDAGEPLVMRWSSASYIDVPIRR
jgi:putative CocE/NonD family hydrolase